MDEVFGAENFVGDDRFQEDEQRIWQQVTFGV